uniref:Olfactory receptor n=1 Tax=Pelusios castaneus TaxID=367368 RepID=A0A8C8SI15_9SAUR
MGVGNHTVVTEFILLGFTNNLKLQVTLFVMFLLIYLIILMGNFTLITLIRIDIQLHTPMYFFIGNLAFLDIGYSSVIIPSMLMTCVAKNKAISFTGCALQFFFFGVAISCECWLLSVMAYDRFMAICSPLLYTVIMSKRFCVMLVVGSYFMSCLNSIVQTVFIFHLSFCDSYINHFFCDVPPILKLSCSDNSITYIVHFTCTTILAITTILIILVSYIYIVVTILRISSAKGQRKAFATCASHLMAVTIFYGTGSFMYLRSNSKYFMDQDKIISVFYTLAIPMLNPLIYCLRNKEVKEAFRRVRGRRVFFLQMKIL